MNNPSYTRFDNSSREHFPLRNMTVDHIIPRARMVARMMMIVFNCFAELAIRRKEPAP